MLLLVAAVVVLAAAAAGWMGWRGLQAREELTAAERQVALVQDQLTDGAAAAATDTLTQLQARTTRARELTSDPLWAVAAVLPLIGDDVTAVREVTAVVDDVAQAALPPLVDAAAALDPQALRPVDGAIDLEPLRAAAPRIELAHGTMTRARDAADAIELDGVDARLAGPVRDLRAQLHEATRTTATAARAAALLPPMLGADGPRTYLVLFQNNAEVRALGGIPGALAVLRADAGRIELVSQASASDLPRFEEPVLPLTEEQRAVYGDRLGGYVQDVTLTPDWDTSAALAREMWRRTTGEQVDGVLSVDPVALSYLLEATGPLPLATGGRLEAGNAVDLLLSQVYSRYARPQQQDLFFAAVAAQVLSALTSGTGEPAALVDQLARAAGERRLLVWSADETENELLAGTVVASPLPDDEAAPVFGVYLNDGTGAKMGYYLRHHVTLTRRCPVGAQQQYDVELRLGSTAPADAAALPEYVTGAGVFGVRPGTVRTVVRFYGPAGATMDAMTRDGQPVGYLPQRERGRPVGTVRVDLAPGESTALVLRVDDDSPGPARVRTTPGIENSLSATGADSCP